MCLSLYIDIAYQQQVISEERRKALFTDTFKEKLAPCLIIMALSKVARTAYRIMEEEESNEKISLHLSKVLDRMGYSRQMVQARRDSYQESNKLLNTQVKGLKVIISGSKGEGLTKPFESDIDVIYLDQYIIATEEDLTHVVQPNTSVFTFNAHYGHPGYNILTQKCLSRCVRTFLCSSLRPTNTGQQILSSDAFAEYITELDRRHGGSKKLVRGRSGPAFTLTSIEGTEFDRVYSIPSVSPTVLMQWLQRPRQYDWPPLDLRQHIARMRGNFVATGCKQSPMEKHEWRQCFNEAELLLVHSLEDTLYKLYILLKIILKDMLRPLDHETVLSFYVMKNIVFWLAETNPTESFQEKYLIKWLLKALCMLKQSLEQLYLPYYMIPYRNLLGPGIKTRVRVNLIGRIQTLIKEGPRLLYRSEKLEYTTQMTHSELSGFSEKRNELEMVHLQQTNYEIRLKTQGLSFVERACDETFQAMCSRQKELIHSPWPPHLLKKLDKCEDDWGKKAVILK